METWLVCSTNTSYSPDPSQTYDLFQSLQNAFIGENFLKWKPDFTVYCKLFTFYSNVICNNSMQTVGNIWLNKMWLCFLLKNQVYKQKYKLFMTWPNTHLVNIILWLCLVMLNYYIMILILLWCQHIDLEVTLKKANLINTFLFNTQRNVNAFVCSLFMIFYDLMVHICINIEKDRCSDWGWGVNQCLQRRRKNTIMLSICNIRQQS